MKIDTVKRITCRRSKKFYWIWNLTLKVNIFLKKYYLIEMTINLLLHILKQYHIP